MHTRTYWTSLLVSLLLAATLPVVAIMSLSLTTAKVDQPIATTLVHHDPGNPYAHAKPYARVVDFPWIKPIRINRIDMYEARLDVLWNPRSTPGCQVDMRLLYQRANETRWTAITHWVTFREYDGNLTARVIGPVLPGPQHVKAEWTLNCPANPGSGHVPYRRANEQGPVAFIIGPFPEERSLREREVGRGTYCDAIICAANPDGTCDAIICTRPTKPGMWA